MLNTAVMFQLHELQESTREIARVAEKFNVMTPIAVVTFTELTVAD
jgi:hypothetical protein